MTAPVEPTAFPGRQLTIGHRPGWVLIRPAIGGDIPPDLALQVAAELTRRAHAARLPGQAADLAAHLTATLGDLTEGAAPEDVALAAWRWFREFDQPARQEP